MAYSALNSIFYQNIFLDYEPCMENFELGLQGPVIKTGYTSDARDLGSIPG